jgi:methylmalonyl-CoA mutase cobalamin-binding subunit
MDNAPASPPKSVLIETGNAVHDVSHLVALTRITEQGLENLQERTGSTKEFTYSAVVPGRTRTGLSSFKLENPDTAKIFEALRAAGRQVIYLRETGEIAPAFPENGVPASGQPHLIGVRDWSYDDNTPADRQGFQSAANVVLADGRNADVYFAAKRSAFVPQSSVVLKDEPKGAG